MKISCKKIIFWFKKHCFFFLLLFICSTSFTQQSNLKRTEALTVTGTNGDLFGTQAGYIENIGQYGDKLAGYANMGKILYGYEGFGMPVLFTNKGLIHLHRQIKISTHEEIEKEERRKKKKGESEENRETIDKTITMEWVNANPNPEIVMLDETKAYYTYGMLTKKARAFNKLIYKELYPGIDVEYSFLSDKKKGFEYSLLLKPGADISMVKMRYGGDVKKIEKDKDGNLIVRSSIDGIIQSDLVGFFDDNNSKGDKFNVSFLSDKNIISFKLPANYNKEKALVIDPFVSSTASLTGPNTSKAKDIDFDYAGNVYVSGGGDFAMQKLAKFDASGVLQWTFSGSLAVPSWNFGDDYGGWVVEKTSGSIYMGQGLAGAGFSVIRLTTAGVYDNYKTTPNSSFGENWKMLYSCRGGSGTILIAGGGGSANNELALLSPPSVIPATSNISGLSGGHNDISDIIMDPLSDEMYTIFSISVVAPAGSDNIIYKHVPPYSAGNRAWSVPAGFFALHEPYNRPYMQAIDNSSNTLAINSGYLFYWDGKNLKAFNKATGASVGTALTIANNAALNQGGIYADECNNVFVGSINGAIKVYKFDGSVFDDAAAADITITGFSSNAVYDLAYDNGKQLLYASGNGFVASFDISAYCPSTIYAVPVSLDCSAMSATATINPVPPAGTTVSYVLYNGAITVANNTTGIFSGLNTGINYTVKAFLNQACGGTQAANDFILTTAPVIPMQSPAPICLPLTADLSLMTTGSSAGLNFTYWLDAAATIPFASPATAAPGTYYIKGTAISGCSAITPVTIIAFPSPIADAGNDATICSGKDIQLHGSGGVLYSWSPATYLDNPGISNPTVVKPKTGSIIYHLKVTDLNGCESQVDEQVKITVTPPAALFIGRDTVLAINQPLQLNAVDINNSGFTNYLWSPSYGLNNALIPNPVAILDRDMTYTLNASTANNCGGSTVIHIKVYKGPEIYVPTAFTPGSDGLNDILRAIPVGIKEFQYFSIYNRYGQIVFTTSDPRRGWDGKIQGENQGSGVFIWMAKGIDYLGNIIQRKGTCTIIR